MVRKRRRRNSKPDVYLACAALLCVHCLFFRVLISKGFAHVRATGIARTANRRPPAPVRPAVIRTPRRPIYPYSVIRAGAYSVAELQAALRADPVAAAHYAVFDRSQLRVTRVSDPAAVYVSYRQGDSVYWTRRKMNLAAGESLITDGVHTARSRCGNRISLTPQEPTATSEPSAMTLDLPELPPVAEPEDWSDEPMMVVHEIFPALLENVPPARLPDDALGPPMLTFAPGGVRFSAPPKVALPLLSGLTMPPPPVVWPIDFRPLPPQPVGPGFLGFQPIPLPVSSGGGSLPPSPPVWSLPTLTGVPFPKPPGALPPGFTVSSGSPSQGGLPPASPSVAETPEPATAALLLCGAIILAIRRRSGRRPR